MHDVEKIHIKQIFSSVFYVYAPFAGDPAILFALTSGDGGGSRPLRLLLYPEMHRQTSARLFL